MGVWPVPYKNLDIPSKATRLLVLMLEEGPAVAAAASRIAREVIAAIGPAPIPAFSVARSSYHVTVTFASLPTDPRPSPLSPDAPLCGSPDCLAEEAAVDDVVRECGVGPIELEVDRVTMAPSGTLLLLFRDTKDSLGVLRKAPRQSDRRARQ